MLELAKPLSRQVSKPTWQKMDMPTQRAPLMTEAWDVTS